MMLIGLTGGIAAGKSTVLAQMAECGAAVIDTDKLSRLCSLPGTSGFKEIVEKFGNSILTSSGEIDRKKLASLVAADKSAKADLEQILHPKIMARLLLEIRNAASSGADMVIIEIPLLFESGLEKQLDRTIAVIAPEEDQIKRLIERGMSEEEATHWIANQWPQEKKAEMADYVIRNTGSLEQLKKEAEKIYDILKKESKSVAFEKAPPTVH